MLALVVTLNDNEYLQHLVRPRRRLLSALDLPEHPEHLVNDLAGDEAAEAGVDELHEGHGQQAQAGLDRGQDFGVS